MKNPTTPDIYRMIRTATILAVSSQARLSEAPGRGATRAGVVLRLLDRSAIVCQSPHRRIASRATTPPYQHSVVQQYPLLVMNRPPAARNRSLLYPRKPTFSWPSLTSGCDPERTIAYSGISPGRMVKRPAGAAGRAIRINLRWRALETARYGSSRSS